MAGARSAIGEFRTPRGGGGGGARDPAAEAEAEAEARLRFAAWRARNPRRVRVSAGRSPLSPIGGGMVVVVVVEEEAPAKAGGETRKRLDGIGCFGGPFPV
ncbi:hypothetical protein OsI_26529 [Oryza sativa Indica Group]|uniref:Uncharacterized protein n=1 Tax=Oryza sativa subsp. indica TaxID=39946 RepID=B8B7H9_ORYSI|nr:hypothetical protein OsI_26529 [Oryza sativa Indica Group]